MGWHGTSDFALLECLYGVIIWMLRNVAMFPVILIFKSLFVLCVYYFVDLVLLLGWAWFFDVLICFAIVVVFVVLHGGYPLG